MPAKFEIAYAITKAAEGVYSNHPNDKGGETYHGIARKKNPSWKGWTLIDLAKQKPGFPKNLSANVTVQTQVREFYKTEFWDKNRLSELLDQNIANEMFDTGVNMGTPAAAMFLQRSLNVLNKRGTLYPDISVDAFVGSVTISLANKYPDPERLFNVLNTLQGAKYIGIAEVDQTQEDFMNGWLTRCYVKYVR